MGGESYLYLTGIVISPCGHLIIFLIFLSNPLPSPGLPPPPPTGFTLIGALYMDRNTIPNINTTSFAFEQNIKYINTRLEILQFPTFNYNTTNYNSQHLIIILRLRVLPLKFRHYCKANDSLIN